jgi:hypothetical protein
MTALFSIVARENGVSVAAVRNSLTTRPRVLDLGVLLSFAALYAFVTHYVVRRVLANFPPADGKAATIIALGVTSILVSGLAVMLGEWYALTAEMTWIGNGHLSYRADRVPWTQHRPALLIGGVSIFCFVVAARVCAGIPEPRGPRWSRRGGGR